jgi:hypothetical protein
MAKEMKIAPSVELPEEFPPPNRKSAFLDVVEDLIRSHWQVLRELLEATDNKEESKIKRGMAAAKIKEIAIEQGFGELFQNKPLTKIRSTANAALTRHAYGTQNRIAKQKLIEAEKKSTSES